MLCGGFNEQKGGSVCVCINTYVCAQACNGHDRNFTHILTFLPFVWNFLYSLITNFYSGKVSLKVQESLVYNLCL